MTGHGGADAFERFVAAIDYPVYLVTARSRVSSNLAGCLVGFAGQVSIQPQRFLVGLSPRNHTYRVAQNSTHLAVHVAYRSDRALAVLFGSRTGDATDKFAHCRWKEGPAGLPILSDAAAWFVGKIEGRLDLGDHVGHLLDPIAGAAPDALIDGMTFSDVRDLVAGHKA